LFLFAKNEIFSFNDISHCKFPADEETVLILLERVNEAQRLAVRELREMQAQDPKNKKRKRGNDKNDRNDKDTNET
jgi:hypothetical protein